MKKMKVKAGFILLFLTVVAMGCLFFDMSQSESRGWNSYNSALMKYKKQAYSDAMADFSRVPLFSTLKSAAVFREARCATLLKDNESAKKKYKYIISAYSNSSISVLSLYNLGVLLYEEQDVSAEKCFNKILKKYPLSQYANPAQYYLGQIKLLKAANTTSQIKQDKLISEAVQRLYTYIEKEPSGKFSRMALDTLIKLEAVTSPLDNLLVAKSLYERGEFAESKIYMDKTSLTENWDDWALLAYKLNDKENTKKYIEDGLNKNSETLENDELYKVIDIYSSMFPSKREAINRLKGLYSSKNIKGYDYILYSDCVMKNGKDKIACYSELYEKYPNGQFAADALANVFLSRYLEKKYSDVDRFGKIHMKKFPTAKSAPMVSYYMGRMSDKTKHREAAQAYYKHTLAKFPDSYYSYRAYLTMNKDNDVEMFDESDLIEAPVVFPYKKSLEKNLVLKLALLGDYDLVEEICKSDQFVQSWIAYKRGQYTRSCILAREAMEKMAEKPEFSDLRWRLVYPIHHWDIISKYKYTNNPIVLLSIMKEESHFDPNAQSHVGARGLMQMMPATEAELKSSYQIQQEADKTVNDIKFGSVYFASLMHGLDNKTLFALAAYNGGIGSVQNWQKTLKFSTIDEFVEQIPYAETNNYVKKILRSYWMYSNVYN